MTGDLQTLVNSADSVALVLFYAGVQVEITPDQVIFRERLSAGDDATTIKELTSFSRDVFEDIVTAFQAMPASD